MESERRIDDITIGPIDPRSPLARGCLTAYAAELRHRFPEGYQDSDLVDPAELEPPHGTLLVARKLDTPIACGGVRTLEPGVGEVRHMWVHPSFRRIGLGRRLLAELEHVATDLGLDVLRLGTHRSLSEAIAMYRRLGYTATESYSDTAHTDFWFAKRLR